MNQYTEIILKEISVATGRAIGKYIEKHLPDALDKIVTYCSRKMKICNEETMHSHVNAVDKFPATAVPEKRPFIVAGFTGDLKKNAN